MHIHVTTGVQEVSRTAMRAFLALPRTVHGSPCHTHKVQQSAMPWAAILMLTVLHTSHHESRAV